MKPTLTLFFAIFCLSGAFSQKAFQFKDAEQFGVRVSELDSTYKSAIHSDSTLAVFQNIDDVITAYHLLLGNFGKYLDANGFCWKQSVSGFNRIYFDADGNIDYFVYNFRGNPLSEEEIKEFDRLLNSFIQTYTFALKGKEKFAQCSPVTYMP